ETTAGDVRHAVEGALRDQAAQDLEVRSMNREQLFADAAPELRDLRLRLHPLLLEQYLARQRVAVGVQAGGGQADQHVPGRDARPVDDVLLLDDADAE